MGFWTWLKSKTKSNAAEEEKISSEDAVDGQYDEWDGVFRDPVAKKESMRAHSYQGDKPHRDFRFDR